MSEVERFSLHKLAQMFYERPCFDTEEFVRCSDYAALQARLSELEAVKLERAANLAADLKKRAHYEQIVLYHHAKAAHDIVEALKGGAR